MERKILYAEDDDGCFEVAKHILMPQDCEIIRAKNGLEAITIMSSGDYFSLILMDLIMPGINGFEAIEAIQSKYDTPIIALTARNSEEERIKCLDIGCKNYIKKPFKINELVQAIKPYLI